VLKFELVLVLPMHTSGLFRIQMRGMGVACSMSFLILLFLHDSPTNVTCSWLLENKTRKKFKKASASTTLFCFTVGGCFDFYFIYVYNLISISLPKVSRNLFSLFRSALDEISPAPQLLTH